MNLKKQIGYLIVQTIVLIFLFLSYFVWEIDLRSAFMLSIVVLGFILNRLIETEKKLRIKIRKQIPHKNLLILIPFLIMIFGLLTFGFNSDTLIFFISFNCGISGIFILLLLSKFNSK